MSVHHAAMLSKKLLVLSACAAIHACDAGNARPPENQPTPPVASTGTPTSASATAVASAPPSAPPASSGATLVTTSCVLHAGGAHVSSRREKGQIEAGVMSASCWFNAECIAMPGNAKPGDGFVSVSCEQTACRCEWSSATSDTTLREPFTIDELPSADGACRRLLIDRCMIGMKLYSKDGGGDAE